MARGRLLPAFQTLRRCAASCASAAHQRLALPTEITALPARAPSQGRYLNSKPLSPALPWAGDGRSWFNPLALLAWAAAGASTAVSLADQKENPSDARALPEELLAELIAALDSERVTTDDDERQSHGKPWNSYHSIPEYPDAVVFPRTTEEVVAIVNACARHGVPIVAYGGGTSLEGHTLAPQCGVSVDFTSMDAVVRLNEDDLTVTVQPGIGWETLNDYLRPKGLFFAVDPGPGATVGGMCATRCSGTLAVRYGTMKDNVVSLRAVLANGDVLKTCARAKKSAAGYDLTRLLIGSEGTLALVTELTLKLHRLPPCSAVAMCQFPSVRAAAAAAASLASHLPVTRCELMDEVMVRAVNLANEEQIPEAVTLMLELSGSVGAVADQKIDAQRIIADHGGTGLRFADTPEEKDKLWRARKEALWSAATLRSEAEAMITDVCVPLSRLADCITETKEELLRSFLPGPIVAHAGDGNFHVILMIDPSREEDRAEAARLNASIVRRAIAMEGTCTGEHGVGTGKKRYLVEELGPEAVALMGRIKRTMDPQGIFNPGKVVDVPMGDA